MIETKEVRSSEKDYIQDLTAFGWQVTQEVSRRTGRVTNYYKIMARETSMPNYSDYHRLESGYEVAKRDIKYYSPMELTTVLLLLILLIIPGVIYIVFKTQQKKEIEEHNNACRQKMQNKVNEARNIK